MSQWFLALVAAPFAGSFVGVVVRRLPSGRSIVWGRSACEHCQHALSPPELLPVLSFLWLRGRCRHCGGRIAPAHLGIELAAVAIAASAAWAAPDSSTLWADCGLGWVLLALACIDWTHLRLPDVLTLPLLLAGLGVAAAYDPDAAPDHAAAAALGYLAMRLVAACYRLWRGRDGLGGGDAKMAAAAGAWVGLAGLGPTILVAAVAGILVTGLRRGDMRATTIVPFGTFLALGTWLTQLYLQVAT